MSRRRRLGDYLSRRFVDNLLRCLRVSVLAGAVFCGGLLAPLGAEEDLRIAFSLAEDIEDGPFDGDLEASAAFAARFFWCAFLGDDAEARGEVLDGIPVNNRGGFSP